MASKKRAIYARQLEDLTERLKSIDTFNLKKPGTRSLGAWFLGPKAENETLLTELIVKGIEEHMDDRRDFHPSDPIWITQEVKDSEEYKESVEAFKQHYTKLVQALTGSVPFFSYRYQAHMNWDITMPGIAGYFAGMLYNQNNVAAEASPITTPLEMMVGDDLCRMLGYRLPSEQEQENGEITPWGHITCDGSVANLESMWACRNLKYYPIALAEALRAGGPLAAAKEITIRLPDGRREVLIHLDTWQLLNLNPDEVLALPTRIQTFYGISTTTLSNVLDNYSIQNLGFLEFYNKFLRGKAKDPVMFAPSTMHYSWPKAAAVLGLGANNIIPIHVDLNARMEVAHLCEKLDEALANKQPVIMTVAVVGSTEESAVDPLANIITIRDQYSQSGLVFPVHVDAAWGGYFASILREDPYYDPAVQGRQYTPAMTMSKYVTQQYEVLGRADSITVDPHKAGYIPYPAGGLCYRNSAMRNLVSFTAPVVYHGGIDPTVGVYGIEGSKPGAAAAGVFLSHRVIRTDQSGYGQILGKSLFNSKRLYAAVVTMAEEQDPFIVVPFNRLPAEAQGETQKEINAQLEYIREEIVPKTNDELIADKEAMKLFRELGSDQIIIAYAFNFKTQEGLNKDVNLLNDLNNEIYDLLHLAPADLSSIGKLAAGQTPGAEDVPDIPLIVTSSDFEPATYGQALVDDFKRRLGVEGDSTASIAFLISTTMDPWLTDTSEGNFIPVIIAALRDAVIKAIAKVSPDVTPEAMGKGA
jgi:glutamate/tyrosine decarboxylase-like PLP-dependent enzyme